MFILIESENENVKMQAKVADLQKQYDVIVGSASQKCQSMKDQDPGGFDNEGNEVEFKRYVEVLLVGLGKTLSDHKYTNLDPKQLAEWDQKSDVKWESRWTWSTSILHTLGILTTTGNLRFWTTGLLLFLRFIP